MIYNYLEKKEKMDYIKSEDERLFNLKQIMAYKLKLKGKEMKAYFEKILFNEKERKKALETLEKEGIKINKLKNILSKIDKERKDKEDLIYFNELEKKKINGDILDDDQLKFYEEYKKRKNKLN